MNCYLSGNIGVSSAAVDKVSVDVVTSHGAVYRMERNPRVVVRDDVRVSILRLVDFDVRRIPRELLSRLDRLVFQRESLPIVLLQAVHVPRQIVNRNRRMVGHF